MRVAIFGLIRRPGVDPILQDDVLVEAAARALRRRCHVPLRVDLMPLSALGAQRAAVAVRADEHDELAPHEPGRCHPAFDAGARRAWDPKPIHVFGLFTSFSCSLRR